SGCTCARLVPGTIVVRNPVASTLSAKLPFSRTTRLVAGGTALVAVVGGTVAFTTLDKDVTLDADGRTSQVSTFAGTVGDVLQAQGVTVGPHDIVAPAADA